MKIRILFFCIVALILGTAPNLARAADAASPAPPPNPHQHLKEILQRPLYQRWQLRQDREADADSSATEAARAELRKFLDWIHEQLEKWLRPRSSSGTAPGSLGAGLSTLFWAIAWIAIGLFVIALIILVVRLIRARNAPLPQGNVLSREQVADALKHGDALAMAGDEWLDEAGRLAAEKNFRAMYRALYLALLSGLHSAGKIDFNRHFTNWTYVNRYRGDDSERKIFSTLTDLFDSVWYGLKQPPNADIRGLRQQVESLTSRSMPGEPRAN